MASDKMLLEDEQDEQDAKEQDAEEQDENRQLSFRFGEIRRTREERAFL